MVHEQLRAFESQLFDPLRRYGCAMKCDFFQLLRWFQVLHSGIGNRSAPEQERGKVLDSGDDGQPVIRDGAASRINLESCCKRDKSPNPASVTMVGEIKHLQ